MYREVDDMFLFDPEGVIFLPGYPKAMKGGIRVAFSLLLPHLVAGPGSLVDAVALEEIASRGKAYIEQHLGKMIVSVERFYCPECTAPPEDKKTATVVAAATGAVAGLCTAVGAAIL